MHLLATAGLSIYFVFFSMRQELNILHFRHDGICKKFAACVPDKHHMNMTTEELKLHCSLNRVLHCYGEQRCCANCRSAVKNDDSGLIYRKNDSKIPVGFYHTHQSTSIAAWVGISFYFLLFLVLTFISHHEESKAE